MSRYRAGPWPGLTPQGAGVLLGCAVFLGVGQALVGAPTKPLPDLPVIGATALLPLVIGVRIVRMPGVASAICGAYLLPASTLSLVQPSIPPPPLLLVPAVAFDVLLWFEPAQITELLLFTWTSTREIIAGAAFGAVLVAVEPPFRVLLGGDAGVWFGPGQYVAALASAIVCGVLATLLTFRGTAT